MSSSSAEKKSTFSQTCSLLSQYLKENGSFGDLSLGMTCNYDTNSSSDLCRQRSTPPINLFPVTTTTPQSGNLTSLSLFPPSPFLSDESISKMAYANSSGFNKPAADQNKKPQMTIFYAGQVYVFDDFPADKVKDVMSLVIENRNHHQQQPTIPVVRYLPITRKASLHRFLEKRKDRIACKAPYQTTRPISVSGKPAIEDKSWLVLAAEAPQ